MPRAWIVFIVFGLVTACTASPQNTPAPATPSPTWTETPTATRTGTSTPTITFTSTWTPTPPPTPLANLKVLSYNILYGAGFDRQWDAGVPPNLVGKNRLPDLIAVVKAINPDIWGIQEATGWDRGTLPVIQQVAQELGMNYALAQVPSGFHIGLVTKFEILETENLSARVGRQGALRARLLSPDGKKVNIFIVHLDPASADTRLCEVNTLIQEMQPYLQQLTILMGDLNFQPRSREHQRLEQAGWTPLAVEPSWGIDQIWAFPSVRWTTTPWFQSLPLPNGISDHNPIGAELNAFLPSVTPPTLTPFPLPPTTLPPAFIADTLPSSRVLRFEGFDDTCAFSRWTTPGTNTKFSNGILELTGAEPWQTFASRYKEFSAGEGALVRLQFARGSEFEIRFDNLAWNTDLYRRFGINVLGNRARVIVWQDATRKRAEHLSDDLSLAPDTWYILLLATDKDDNFVAQIWDPAEPSRVVKYREPANSQSPRLPWFFGISANKGKVAIDSLTEISTNAIK